MTSFPAPAPSPVPSPPTPSAELRAPAPGWAPACVVFDCDGILMDTEANWARVQRLVAESYGLEYTEALERRILAGERIGAPEIRAACGALKAGKRGRQTDQRAPRVAA